MNRDHNLEIWERSKLSTKSFWNTYHQLIRFTITDQSKSHVERPEISVRDESGEDFEDNDIDDCDNSGQDNEDEVLNEEYLEFIKITKQHQLERDRLKRLETSKQAPEKYYTDIAELNTLVLDNITQIPDPETENSQQKRREQLVNLYGSADAYERIRSMEMSIDDTFKTRCRERNPQFWPVMPINPKPYLNEIDQ